MTEQMHVFLKKAWLFKWKMYHNDNIFIMLRLSQLRTLIYLSVYRYVFCMLYLYLKKYSGLRNQFFFVWILTPANETAAKSKRNSK